MSPNRTCYLSPTGVALTSSVLGFHQSPVHTTDSENNDDENNDENDYENNDKNDVNNGENNDDDFNLELMPSGDEDEAAQKSENKVILHQTSAAENVKIAAAGDDAVTADDSLTTSVVNPEESVEAIKVKKLLSTFVIFHSS